MTFLDDIKFISQELGKTKREIHDGTQKIIQEFTDVKSDITGGVESPKNDIQKTKAVIKKEVIGDEGSGGSKDFKTPKKRGYGDEIKRK